MTLGLLLFAATSGMATQVELNGEPVAFDVAPFQLANRTMVPMRAIFEALGADVHWNESTQTVTATRDTTDVQLTIGSTRAQVNGQAVALDVPPMVSRGSTMVPLRFVSESLGADVSWSELTQTVSISTTGAPNTDPVLTTQTVVIPRGTVIPVRLNKELSSLTNDKGDAFTVSVRSDSNGDAEFPRGTNLAGKVVGVQQATAGQPGTLDLGFSQARLPDDSKATIDGSLISLDDQSVTRSSDGRLVATAKAKDDRLMMIGIGAGAGLLIGKLLDQNLIVGGLLGGAAGYFYSEFTKDKGKAKDVVVSRGTEFGVRMDRDVTYTATEAFVAAHDAYSSTQ